MRPCWAVDVVVLEGGEVAELLNGALDQPSTALCPGGGPSGMGISSSSVTNSDPGGRPSGIGISSSSARKMSFCENRVSGGIPSSISSSLSTSPGKRAAFWKK